MSQKTVLPPEGPAGPARGTPPERSLLLSDFHDACDNRSDSAAPEEEVARSPPESPSEGRGTAPGGNSTNGELVRTQPQRLPQPTASVEPGDGDAGQSQNGRRVGLSNGAGLEPRRHPSTVSHKVQRKLQSSLSVHSDSSRKSKTSSGSSHKPGSSPEGVLRGLQPGGLLLLLRRRPGRRLQLPLRHGLRHHGRLLRVLRLPGDLHGVLRDLLPHIGGRPASPPPPNHHSACLWAPPGVPPLPRTHPPLCTLGPTSAPHCPPPPLPRTHPPLCTFGPRLPPPHRPPRGFGPDQSGSTDCSDPD
ncbi:myoD family inhibitor domain-containing protein isoform X1 [Anguilla rostrata]|uniref:myoD family inhibitor domain-containing protein isoform X1 n=1 Tax=Anguilla rostrata TaxID=7938 RepID=UPI0030CFADA8